MGREDFPQELARLDPGIVDNSILTAYRGSRAHGMWVDAGDPNSIAMVNQTGGIEKYARRRRWWTDHHGRFAAALL